MNHTVTLSILLAAAPAVAEIEIPATANLYGAGKEVLPEPAGGGGGTPPVVIPVAALPDRALKITHINGTIFFGQFGSDDIPNPDGVGTIWGGTNLDSHEGIAGIECPGRVGFLAGVFLGDEVPEDPAPDRTLYTDGVAYELTDYWPALRQSFFIGDGRNANGEAQQFHAPEGATRLALGFVDGLLAFGPPGQYGDNHGSLYVGIVQEPVVVPITLIATAIEIGWQSKTNETFVVQSQVSPDEWVGISEPISGSNGLTTWFLPTRGAPKQNLRVVRVSY